MTYSLSDSSVLLRIDTDNYLKRGVGVRWLPSGAMHTATVPHGKRGGDELIVDVPLAPVAVVVGTPVSVE